VAEPIDPALAAYVDRFPAGAQESARWGAERQIQLRITVHLSDEPPPPALVSSVRCLLFRGDELMVLRNRHTEAYIVPGGRREGDEPIDATLRREVGEETGWTLRDPELLGCYRMHHVSAKPDGYPYPYPDLLQSVYMAEADQHRPELLLDDGYDLGGDFRPPAEVARLKLTACERILLAEALRRRVDRERPS
jgi:8-oxo-dGTP pyrophosphatase MutT (NUDIX family)